MKIGHQVEQSLKDRVSQKRPPRIRPCSTHTIGQNLQPDTSTVAVNKKLTFRSVSTIVLPFYAIVFALFVRMRIYRFYVACTRLIGRRDRTVITIVLRHV